MTENLINLTPHEITIIDMDGGKVVLPKSENAARVDQNPKCCGFINLPNGQVIEMKTPEFGEVTGLPEYQVGTMYIVSAMVRAALPNRFDLVSPGNLIRDDDGNVTGCECVFYR